MLRSFAFSSLVVLVGVCGCAAGGSPEENPSGESEGAVEVKDGDLWAGLTSITIARMPQDPCDDGQHRLDTDPVVYDEYARERATARNVCFEVYEPGVTDRENADFWKSLDVRVQYRFVGAKDWKEEYVDAIDRRGNNRRYAWELKFDRDPLYAASELGDMQAPFDITREWPGGISISSKMELTFTVNGHKLTNSKNQPFVVDYVGAVRIPQLQTLANGHVLHQEVACDGLKLGTGAGYMAADVTDPAAITKLTPAIDGSMLPGSRIGANTPQGTPPTIVSMAFGSETPVSGQTWPRYYEETYDRPPKGEVRPDGTKMILSLPVYDRAAKAMKRIEVPFDHCH